MNATGKKLNRTKADLIVDMLIFGAFLIVAAPQFSGMAVHEWLGVAFGAGILTHLLLHWQWIVGITKKFFGRVQTSARINYLLNLLLFADMVILIFSGLAISKVAMPALGAQSAQIAESGLWKGLHHTTADAAVLLIGLHVALNWSWIMKTSQKYLVSPITMRIASKRAGSPRVAHQPAALKLTVNKLTTDKEA
jgi:hypothetical protein